MRKGQVSLFIILGLVLLTLVGTILYAITLVNKNTIDSEERIVRVEQSVSEIEGVIDQCLRESADNATFTIAKQGGLFYETQLGYNKQFENVSIATINFRGEDEQVTKLINFRDRDNKRIYTTTPAYPCPTSLDRGTRCSLQKHDFCFFEFTQSTSCDIGNLDLAPLSGINYSIQNQLKNAVEELTLECIAKSAEIEEITNQDLVELEVNIEDSGVFFNLDFPIKRTNNQQSTTISKFTYSSKPRFQKIHNILSSSLRRENREFDHDYETKLKERTDRINDIETKIIKNVNQNRDTIVIVTDKLAAYSNLPFEYKFLIENRPPALETIQSRELNSQKKRNKNVDFYLTVGDTLTIEPFAIDPDGDAINYTYSGWKADYDEVYDSQMGCTNPSIWQNKREETPCTQNGQVIADTNGNPKQNPQRATIDSNKWHESNLFAQTRKSASIKLTADDIGWHDFRVTVSDGIHSEYQDVRVIVAPKPFPIIDFNNMLIEQSENENEFISIENPFYFSSINTITTGFPVSKRNWYLNNETMWEVEGQVDFMLPDYSYNGNTAEAVLNREANLNPDYEARYSESEYELLENYLVDIKKYQIMDKLDNGYDGTGKNQLKLEVGLQGSNSFHTTLFKFTSQKCSYYASPIAPWPFNLVQKKDYTIKLSDNGGLEFSNANSETESGFLNPFRTHTSCCDNTGVESTYKSSNNACFSYEYETSPLYFPSDVYEALRKINDNTNNKIRSVLSISANGPINPGDTRLNAIYDDNANDVISQEIENKCSGDRGNTCTGDFTWYNSFSGFLEDVDNTNGENVQLTCDNDTAEFRNDIMKQLKTKEVKEDKPYGAGNSYNYKFTVYDNTFETIGGKIFGGRCRGSLDQNGKPTNVCNRYTGTTFENIIKTRSSALKELPVNKVETGTVCSKGHTETGCMYKINGISIMNLNDKPTLLAQYTPAMTNLIKGSDHNIVIKEHEGSTRVYSTQYSINTEFTCEDGWCRKPISVSSCDFRKVCTYNANGDVMYIREYQGTCNDEDEFNPGLPCNFITNGAVKNRDRNGGVLGDSKKAWKYNLAIGYQEEFKDILHCDSKIGASRGIREASGIQQMCTDPNKPIYDWDDDRCYNPCEEYNGGPIAAVISPYKQGETQSNSNNLTMGDLSTIQSPVMSESEFSSMKNRCLYNQFTTSGGRCVYRITNNNQDACRNHKDIWVINNSGEYQTINTGSCKLTENSAGECFGDMKQYNYKANGASCKFNDECASGYCRNRNLLAEDAIYSEYEDGICSSTTFETVDNRCYYNIYGSLSSAVPLDLADYSTFARNYSDDGQIRNTYFQGLEGRHRKYQVWEGKYCFYSEKQSEFILSSKSDVLNADYSGEKIEKDYYFPTLQACITNETLFDLSKWGGSLDTDEQNEIADKVIEWCTNRCGCVEGEYNYECPGQDDFESVCGKLLNTPYPETVIDNMIKYKTLDNIQGTGEKEFFYLS